MTFPTGNRECEYPDDAAYQASIGRGWTTNHGCDGCCEPRKDHA